jgi:hypothetical protein
MPDDIIASDPNANLPDHARRMQDLLGGVANIANTIADAGGVSTGLPFMGINQQGFWSYGQDRTEVEPGSRWAIDVRTLQHGYIAWPDQKAKERKPLGEKMVPANSPLPDLATLPNVGQPYQVQFAFQLMCMSGEDKAAQALFKNGSYGAKAAIQSLVEELRKQARVNINLMCPVIELQVRSYFHPDWKRDIYNPVFAIKKWITFEDYDALAQGPAIVQAEPEPAAAPAPVQPEPEPAAAPAPKAAARGNGRRAAPAPEPAPANPPARRRPSARNQPPA